MSSFLTNPIFKTIADELKKAATEYQQQQQQLHRQQPFETIPKTKDEVRIKSKQQDQVLKNAELLMKIQLAMLAVILFVIWILLKANQM